MRRVEHCCLIVAALGAAGVASGQLTASTGSDAAPSLSARANTPLVALENPAREHGVELMLDLNRFDALLAADNVVLRGVPVDKGVTLDLDMTRFSVMSDDATVEVWSDDGVKVIDSPEVVLLRGSVVGEDGSTAFLALSETGVNGYIQDGDQTYVISNGRYGSDDAIVAYNLTALPEGAMTILDFVCRADDVDQPFGGKPQIRDGDTTTRTTCDVIEIAYDTDYQFTSSLFGGNQSASTAYIQTIVGAMNTIYLRDVNASFEISYIRLWGTNSDPYSGDVVSYLYTMQSEWTSNPALTGIHRDVASVLSPTNGGGGVAWVDTVCNFSYQYSACANLAGFFPQPLGKSSQNWDIVVTSHELGHNCGTGHTHDSYSPPIDGCGNGNCAGASNGTIMSYCHLCSPGMSNMNLEFHPRVQTVIEAALANKSCVGTAGPPTFTLNPVSQTACQGDPVTFTASATNPGTIWYQWYFGAGTIPGATSSSYTIASVGAGNFGDYSVEAITLCDSTFSSVATLSECASVACGPADITTAGAGIGDPGYGVPDGAVTAADLNYFVNAWVAGDAAIADVTTTGAGIGDPGYGVPDGNVTAADLNFFVNDWVVGCP